jgi:hypothetical protein
MGIVSGIINKIIDRAGGIIEEAAIDKDKLIEYKAKLEELRIAETENARNLAIEEMKIDSGKTINLMRALPRPLWAILSALIFSFASFTYIYSWWLKAMKGINVEPITLPWMLFAIIAQVVTFYFGARFFEKKNGTTGGASFIEKLGENL